MQTVVRERIGNVAQKANAFSERNPWVVILVQSFHTSYEITESLDDFRYEPHASLRVCPNYTHPCCV